MVHLNPFRRQIQFVLPAFVVGNILFTDSLHSGVIQFFNPLQTSSDKNFNVNAQAFIANDPVSLSTFFDDWHGKYNYKNGQNVALLDSRIDVGMGWENSYIGYFYQYDVFIDTNEDFTNLFYQIKNKNELVDGKKYNLALDIEAIKQHGILYSHCGDVYDARDYSVRLGGAVYLSYGLDMQDGEISGYAMAHGAKDYDIATDSSYAYTHNYLYDLDVKNSYAYGFGSHFALEITDKKRALTLTLLANDVLSKMYWKDLPYSQVSIKTENKNYDNDGYAEYTPMVSGLEKYQDYTQTLSPKYKVDLSIQLNQTTLFAGTDFVYGENFPYVKIAHAFDSMQRIEFMHESRFGSFGFGYGYKNFKVSLMADEFSDNSSFGLNSSFIFRF